MKKKQAICDTLNAFHAQYYFEKYFDDYLKF